jgi:hypothetical protein
MIYYNDSMFKVWCVRAKYKAKNIVYSMKPCGRGWKLC